MLEIIRSILERKVWDALLLEKFPQMENVEVKLRLWESGDDMHMRESSQGHGRINIERFLK